MITEKINWLDGKSADGMFVLEMLFRNGQKGYLKSKTHEVAMERYMLALGYEEVISMTIHDPSGRIVQDYSKYSKAV
jgi:hypothetical protein